MREEYLAEEMNERDDLFEDIPDDELEKYIGKENADKLLEYAATVENTETDPRIVQLLLAER